MKHALTEAERTRIAAAVATAEQRTSGEIVPYIVAKSANYEVALWRGAGLFALIASALVLLARWLSGWSVPLWLSGYMPVVITLLAAAVGALFVQAVPVFRRRFAGDALLTRSVHQRAIEAFVEKEVFATRDRTGILLFVSLLEHRIEVVGDSGINSRVSQEDWADVVRLIRDGIKAGRLADGLAAGIDSCGHLLKQSGVEIRPDDTNELADEVSFGV